MLLLRNIIFRYKEALAGMLLLRNAVLGTKGPCGHVTAQKCDFCWYEKVLVGMLLVRNVIF